MRTSQRADCRPAVGQYIFGYNSTLVKHLYDEREYYDGKEVAIDAYIN